MKSFCYIENIEEVTEAISNSLHVEKERVRIIVNEVPSSHWGIAGVSRKEIDKFDKNKFKKFD
jgi:4-oxalocrotonate tautomerase family enzyme